MNTRRSVARLRRWLGTVVAVQGMALVSPCALPAQAGGVTRIAGVVTDSTSGVGVAGVELRVDGTTLRALTDERGAFRFAEAIVPAGTLRVRRLGYRPHVQALSAEGGVLSVQLAPVARHLQPVTVRGARMPYSGRLAGYYERLERRTIGQFITRADLDRERPAQLSDMLQRMAGLRVVRERPGAPAIHMRGRDCRPLVWLDGVAMSAGEVDLDAFSPESMEGVELYLGGATAPPRYQGVRGQASCGSILIWSRVAETRPRGASSEESVAALEGMLAASTVFTADQVDQPAVLDSTGVPAVDYPQGLRASRMSGLVVVEFVVDTAGHVEPSTVGIVSATHPLFAAAAREAIAGAGFVPARRGGRAVRQIARQPFDFQPTARER